MQLSDNEWHCILDQALTESRETQAEELSVELIVSAIERIADAVIGAKKYGTLADKPPRPY